MRKRPTTHAALLDMLSRKPPGDDCMEWPRKKNADGYGLAYVASKRVLAHRLAYQVENGTISDDLLVLHRCDNPPCIRPSHLLLGTSGDNMKDMVRKGRSRRGEKNQNAKLTDKKVMLMRKARRDGATLKALGLAFGVSQSAAHYAVSGQQWRHVTEAANG